MSDAESVDHVAGSAAARRADLEKSIAEAEHSIEDRMQRLADSLSDSEEMHHRADQISGHADRHEERARRLREASDRERNG